MIQRHQQDKQKQIKMLMAIIWERLDHRCGVRTGKFSWLEALIRPWTGVFVLLWSTGLPVCPRCCSARTTCQYSRAPADTVFVVSCRSHTLTHTRAHEPHPEAAIEQNKIKKRETSAPRRWCLRRPWEPSSCRTKIDKCPRKMSRPVCVEKCSKLMRYTHFYRMQSIVFGSCLSQ